MVCVFLALLSVAMHNWLALVLFSLFAAVFVVVCVLYGSTLILDEQGLSLRFFGLPLRAMRWSEIAEVGVVGLKVFNNNDAKRTGPRRKAVFAGAAHAMSCLSDPARYRRVIEEFLRDNHVL